MNNNQIINMKIESEKYADSIISDTDMDYWEYIVFEHFAKLVAEKEREGCAKLCENSIASIWEYSPDDVKEAGTNVCNNLAKAIRSRGQE